MFTGGLPLYALTAGEYLVRLASISARVSGILVLTGFFVVNLFGIRVAAHTVHHVRRPSRRSWLVYRSWSPSDRSRETLAGLHGQPTGDSRRSWCPRLDPEAVHYYLRMNYYGVRDTSETELPR